MGFLPPLPSACGASRPVWPRRLCHVDRRGVVRTWKRGPRSLARWLVCEVLAVRWPAGLPSDSANRELASILCGG